MSITNHYERVTAGEIHPGDRVARARTRDFHRVASVGHGEVAVRIIYHDRGGSDRPLKTARWWRIVEVSS